MKIILTIIASLVVPVLLFAGAAGIISLVNKRQVALLAAQEEQKRAEANRLVAADTVGGSTPAETLALFSAALRNGDAEQVGKLCVPALREHVAEVVRKLNKEEREATALQLESIKENVTSTQAVSLTVTEPVYVELIRYPSGVWKVASF